MWVIVFRKRKTTSFYCAREFECKVCLSKTYFELPIAYLMKCMHVQDTWTFFLAFFVLFVWWTLLMRQWKFFRRGLRLGILFPVAHVGIIIRTHYEIPPPPFKLTYFTVKAREQSDWDIKFKKIYIFTLKGSMCYRYIRKVHEEPCLQLKGKFSDFENL